MGLWALCRRRNASTGVCPNPARDGLLVSGRVSPYGQDGFLAGPADRCSVLAPADYDASLGVDMEQHPSAARMEMAVEVSDWGVLWLRRLSTGRGGTGFP